MKTFLALLLSTLSARAQAPGQIGMTNDAPTKEFQVVVVTWTDVADIYMHGQPQDGLHVIVEQRMGWETQRVVRAQTSIGTIDFVAATYPGPFADGYRRITKTKTPVITEAPTPPTTPTIPVSQPSNVVPLPGALQRSIQKNP